MKTKTEWRLIPGRSDVYELRTYDGKVLARVYEGMMGWVAHIDSTYSSGFLNERLAKEYAQKQINKKLKGK